MSIISQAELTEVIESNLTEFATIRHLHGVKAACRFLAGQILGGRRGEDDHSSGSSDNTRQ